MPAPAVGIDLGTTNSVVAVSLAGRPQVLSDGNHGPLIPSVVSFLETGERLVGRTARVRRAIDPAHTVASVKRLLGRPFKSEEVRRAKSRVAFDLKEGPDSSVVVSTRGGDFSLPEISAMVLREVRRVAEQGLNQRIDRCVVTVPANFNELQRSSTKIAGRIAELEVIRILNEPTAAALAYGYGRGTREKICIYDFGGGTFDVTLLELAGNVFEVLATAGDTFLGGDDLDTALTDWLVPHLLRTTKVDALQDRVAYDILRDAAESAKCALSTQEATTAEFVYQPRKNADPLRFLHRITRAELERLAAPFVSRTFDVCNEALKLAGLKAGDLTAVILVGGSTRIPSVRQRVASFFGRDPLTNLPPEEVVALGAAILAEALTGGARRVTTRQGAASATASTAPAATVAPTAAEAPTSPSVPAPASNFRGATLAGVAPQPPSYNPAPAAAARTAPPPVPEVARVRSPTIPPTPAAVLAPPASAPSAAPQRDFDLDDPFAGGARPVTSRAPTPLPAPARQKPVAVNAPLDKLDDPSFMGKLPSSPEASPEATVPGTMASPTRTKRRTGEHPQPAFNLDESSVVTPIPTTIPALTGAIPAPVAPASVVPPEPVAPSAQPAPLASLSLAPSPASGAPVEGAELPSLVPELPSLSASLPIIARPSAPPLRPSAPVLPPVAPSSLPPSAPPGERASVQPPSRVSSPGIPISKPPIGAPPRPSHPGIEALSASLAPPSKPPLGAPPRPSHPGIEAVSPNVAPPSKPPIGAPPRPSFPSLPAVNTGSAPPQASPSAVPPEPTRPSAVPAEPARPLSLGLSAAAVAALPPSIAAAISPPPSIGLSPAAVAALPPSIAAAISPPPSPASAPPIITAAPVSNAPPVVPMVPDLLSAPPLLAPMFPAGGAPDELKDPTREVSVPTFQLDDTLFAAAEDKSLGGAPSPDVAREVSVPSFRIDADDIFGGSSPGSSTLVANVPSFDDILGAPPPAEERTTILHAAPPPAPEFPLSTPAAPAFAAPSQPAAMPAFDLGPAPTPEPEPELPTFETEPTLVVPPPLGAGVSKPPSIPSDVTSTIQVGPASTRPGLPPAPPSTTPRPPAPTPPPAPVARSAPPAISSVPGAPLLLDVTPFSLGVETAGGLCEPVIRRNSTIPVEQTRVFATTNDDQESVIIRIAQGESRRFADNQGLGELELAGLRKAPRGDVSIAVTFELEADGTLKVRARDVETGREQAIRVTLLTLPSEAQQAEMAARIRPVGAAAQA
jgi:molecular chaperone DnaK